MARLRGLRLPLLALHDGRVLVRSLSRLGFVVALAGLPGCGQVVVGGFGEGSLWHRAPPPVPVAAHPITGSALEGGAKPRDPDLVQAKAAHCRPWPLRDEVTVEVKGDLVCVAEDVHVLSYESGPMPVLTLPTEISTSNGGTRKIAMQAEGESSKVGVCHGLDSMRTAVWSRRYRGCVPNQGLVDAKTESLALANPGAPLRAGYETIRWTFAPAPAAPTSLTKADVPAARPARPKPEAPGAKKAK